MPLPSTSLLPSAATFPSDPNPKPGTIIAITLPKTLIQVGEVKV
jgi:hypothetical protein